LRYQNSSASVTVTVSRYDMIRYDYVYIFFALSLAFVVGQVLFLNSYLVYSCGAVHFADALLLSLLES